jgi:hypothetical protein
MVPLYWLVHVPHCIGAPNTSSYIIRGKGKAYLFIAQIGRYILYRECGAGSDVFSVHAGT